jgi:hypothetical protein
MKNIGNPRRAGGLKAQANRRDRRAALRAEVEGARPSLLPFFSAVERLVPAYPERLSRFEYYCQKCDGMSDAEKWDHAMRAIDRDVDALIEDYLREGAA